MKVIIAIVSILVVAGFGFFVFGQRLDSSRGAQKTQEKVSETVSGQGADVGSASGVIAGSVTPYKEFTKEEYDRAVADGKVVFLNFYANWCPVCRAEASEIAAGFDELNNPNVVGFRVNFKDDETDESEKVLAQEFGITYQHSKVIVKGRETLYKQIAEQWDREKVVKELGKF